LNIKNSFGGIFLRKNVKRLLVSGSLILGFVIPGVASAYSGSYSFDIAARVEGTKQHSLDNKKTTTTVTANTYGADGKVQSLKSHYTVELYKSLFTNYSVTILADGNQYTRSFGTVNKGTYTINVTKNDDTGYGSRVKGSGTINQ
jgi:hypothetical protein